MARKVWRSTLVAERADEIQHTSAIACHRSLKVDVADIETRHAAACILLLSKTECTPARHAISRIAMTLEVNSKRADIAMAKAALRIT